MPALALFEKKSKMCMRAKPNSNPIQIYMMDAVVHSGRSQSLRVDSQVSKENGDSTELKMPLHKANMCLLGIVVWEIG